MNALVGNNGFHVFGTQQIHQFPNLLKQIAMYFILIHQIHTFAKETDFDKSSSHISFWVRMEQQGSGPFQITAFIKPKFL